MTLRTLVVTHTFPWPALGGGAIRAAHTIDALARLGPVDVACIVSDDAAVERPVPADAPVDRVSVFVRPRRGVTRWRKVPWLVTSRLPSTRIADYAPMRARFVTWAADYDLVWLGCGTEAFVALGPVLRPGVRVVANLDDIEDRKIESRLLAGPDGSPNRTPWPRDQAGRLVAQAEIRRWRRLHVQMASAVDRVVVCSEVDMRALAALGVTNTDVVPNVYTAPVSPAGRLSVGDTPTLSLVGTLHYMPNLDAAQFMVHRVFPEVRRRLPHAELRLVGRSGPGVTELTREPGVVATGLVDDLTAELAKTDVSVVPVRFGSGTRIKILEAFAHRIPVVSTTIGAEGLDVVHGRDLLLADDAPQFAAACVEALTDEGLRSRLVNHAHAQWSHNHRPESLRDRVTSIAGELACPAPGETADRTVKSPE